MENGTRGEEACAIKLERVDESVSVLCDKRFLARKNGKLFKMVVRAAMIFGLKTVAQQKKTGGTSDNVS